ncbi:hypothetical protein VTJ83DRAFT_2875 [Remersonia thermophila]|uniref:BTB domain-containing protein n=1 Tax=Remersonia thermophila TaxID=72144 RepID=A0ABR4DCF6_9PEZI
MAHNTYFSRSFAIDADSKLLRRGAFSDVTVKCGAKTWKLHRNILCTRSVWFEKALTGPFKEASTGVVEIQDTDRIPTASTLC